MLESVRKRKMSKNEEDKGNPRKRLRRNYGHRDFPKMEGTPLLEVDFLPYADTHEPDIIITNGKVEFEAHAKILKVFSTVIADIIEGDAQVSEINMKYSDETLEMLYDMIYSRPGSESRHFTVFHQRPDFRLECLYLIAKWDMTFLKRLFNLYYKWHYCPTHPMAEFNKFYDLARKLKLSDIATLAESDMIHHMRYFQTLEGAKPELVVKMIQACDFEDDMNLSFFKKVACYLRSNNHHLVRDEMHQVKSKSWDSDVQNQFMKMQIKILIDAL